MKIFSEYCPLTTRRGGGCRLPFAEQDSRIHDLAAVRNLCYYSFDNHIYFQRLIYPQAPYRRCAARSARRGVGQAQRARALSPSYKRIPDAGGICVRTQAEACVCPSGFALSAGDSSTLTGIGCCKRQSYYTICIVSIRSLPVLRRGSGAEGDEPVIGCRSGLVPRREWRRLDRRTRRFARNPCIGTGCG